MMRQSVRKKENINRNKEFMRLSASKTMIMPACKHNVSFNNQVLKGEMHTENDPWREKKYNSEIKILIFFVVVVLNITFQYGRHINEETFLIAHML